ncbi:MAG: fimbrillin family protein [Bacteroidaceae bacterium]|nr:fimbrillin family protein [Bacteroidaceae bacterium]
MKYTTILTMMAASALTLAACEKDMVEMQPTELAVTSAIDLGLEVEAEADTRSTLQQNNAFLTSPAQPFSLYAVPYATSHTSDTSTPVSVNANGSTAQSTGKYWPASGGNLDIYAWYPAAAVSATALNATNKTFTILADQSTEANFRSSDLMFATLANQSHTSGNATETKALTFTHKLVLIQVVLSPNTAKGIAASDLTNATITIGSSDGYVIGTVPIMSITGGTLGTPSTRLTSVLTLCSANYSSTNANAYAIIPPQNLNGLKLNVTLKASGKTLTATLPDLAMTAGNAYKYTVTVAATELKVTASINPWTNATWTGGSSTMTF